MKRKEARITLWLNGKTRLYLERLGFLDGRTGKKAKESSNLNRFLNECLILVCEAGAHPRCAVASPEELSEAWIKFQVGLLHREIEDRQRAIAALAARRPLVVACREALR